MKKFLFIVGVIILAGGIFIGGLFAGTSLDFMNGLFQVSTFDQALVDVTMTSMKIAQLDEGKIEQVKDSLNLKLDIHIMTLNEFMKDHPNAESKGHAQKALARIAEHRIKYPVTGNEDAEDPVQQILDRALENRN